MRAHQPAHALNGRRDAGVVIVELALVLFILLLLIVGTLQVAHALYVFNSVQEVTRRAARLASITDFNDPAAMDALRRAALFDSATLPLASNIGTAQLRIEYLAQDASGAPVPLTEMPTCPQRNVLNCARDPMGGTCIAFVRASICTADDCQRLPYQPLTSLAPGFAQLRIPLATTLVKAERLGYQPGTDNCL